MISDGVDVVSDTTGTLIFSPTAYELLWASLGFRVLLIDLLGVQGKMLRIERT